MNKIQCENCCSYNVVDDNLGDEVYECWNCNQRSFIDYQGLIHYMLRTGRGEIESYQDLETNEPKIVNGYI